MIQGFRNVTGIIAANRNNGQGIAGMLSGARILACKILNASNRGLTSNLIAATTYARLRGVPVMNLSLQNYPFVNFPHKTPMVISFRICLNT